MSPKIKEMLNPLLESTTLYHIIRDVPKKYSFGAKTKFLPPPRPHTKKALFDHLSYICLVGQVI